MLLFIIYLIGFYVITRWIFVDFLLYSHEDYIAGMTMFVMLGVGGILYLIAKSNI